MNENNRERGLKRPDYNNRKPNFSGKCDVRLSAEEDSMLNKLSEDNGVTRSDVMRKALKNYFRYLTDEE